MRVLMVNDYRPGAGWGAEVHLARLIAGLEAAGDTVESFAPEGERRGVARVLDMWDPATRRRLRGLAAAFRPGVVHFHNFQRELSASVLGAVPFFPRAMSVHDHRLFGEDNAGRVGVGGALDAVKPLKARVERAVARRRIHVVTAPSLDLVERLRRDGFLDVYHVPYFVDPGPEPVSPPSASEEIAFVGRVSVDKGVTDLLAAFERVSGRHPGARLTIVGGGDELAAIRSSVSAAVADRIAFMGRLDAGGVRAVMTRVRAICIPSRKREGSPITAIEAALAGRPVVVSDDPGLKELVEEGRYGIVAPRSDVKRIASGLEALLSDPTEADRLGTAGRAHALVRWTTEIGIGLTRLAYERAIERASVSAPTR